MNRKHARTLSTEDARAVDLLLDLGADNAHAVTRLATATCQKRVSAATAILARLDALPAGDPPAGMVARTMARIDGASMPVAARPSAATPLHLH